MALGEQLAPHLPFLRRFVRALSGSQAVADRLVRATLERIVENPGRFPRQVEPRLGLYRTFLDIWREDGERQLPSGESALMERTAHARLASMSENAREALLLTALEGFTPKDAGWLLDLPELEVGNLVADALREIEKQTQARVLIIEDEPIIAMDIETIVRDLGHDVIGVAITRREAVALALEDRPGLILADIDLADGSSGIDAVRDILIELEVPVIFVTAFPERLLTGDRPEPSFLVTKPFQRSTLKAAISQSLFFNEHTIPETPTEEFRARSADVGPNVPTVPAPSLSAARQQLRALEAADLEPLPAPVNAAVIGRRLRQVRSASVATRLGSDRIATLWQLHAATAERIADELQGSNVGRAFAARVVAVHHAFGPTPNDNDALAIGVHSHGLSALLPVIRDTLMDDVAADLDAFLADIRQLAEHFNSYREFVGEASLTPTLPPEQTAALVETAKLLESAPDNALDPALKESIAEVRSTVEDGSDPITRLALLRTVGNVLKGLARYLLDLSKSAAKKFAEEVGGELGKLTVKLLRGGILMGLAHFAPAGLSWVLTMLAAAELLAKSGKDDSKGE